MGELRNVDPVLMFSAVFAPTEGALDWAKEKMQQHWAPIALSSPVFQFTETEYYAAEMGAELLKQLVVLEPLQAPEWLPGAKRQSNQWEAEYQQLMETPDARPVNIDPGYVTLAKLVLATTKDRDHRLYLGQGIYGEVTLHYKHGQWTADRWTYPDFQRADYHLFLEQCREYLKSQKKQRP